MRLYKGQPLSLALLYNFREALSTIYVEIFKKFF